MKLHRVISNLKAVLKYKIQGEAHNQGQTHQKAVERPTPRNPPSIIALKMCVHVLVPKVKIKRIYYGGVKSWLYHMVILVCILFE